MDLLDYDVITDLISFFICCVLCALRCLVSAFHPKSIFVHIQADSTDSLSLSVNVAQTNIINAFAVDLHTFGELMCISEYNAVFR